MDCGSGSHMADAERSGQEVGKEKLPVLGQATNTLSGSLAALSFTVWAKTSRTELDRCRQKIVNQRKLTVEGIMRDSKPLCSSHITWLAGLW